MKNNNLKIMSLWLNLTGKKKIVIQLAKCTESLLVIVDCFSKSATYNG